MPSWGRTKLRRTTPAPALFEKARDPLRFRQKDSPFCRDAMLRKIAWLQRFPFRMKQRYVHLPSRHPCAWKCVLRSGPEA